MALNIARVLHEQGAACPVYWEPFVGGGSTFVVTDPRRRRVASDVNADLMALWVAVARGWKPPAATRGAYKAAMSGAGAPEARAFFGFGAAFGGTWGGGYSEVSAEQTRGSLARYAPVLRGVEFRTGDYAALGADLLPDGWLIYCDPPYQGTTGYSAVGAFDSARFWAWVRVMSARNIVYVSELGAPEDFRIVGEWKANAVFARTNRTNRTTASRMERLYRWAGA